MGKKLFLFSIFLSVLVFTTAETWRIASLDWEPYCGSHIENHGILVEKLQDLLKNEDIKLKINFYPWDKSKKLAETKSYIGYFPAWPEEVKEGFISSPQIGVSYIGIMTYKNSKVEFKELRSLFKKYKIGLIKTYVYPESISNIIEKYRQNVVYVRNEKILSYMLSNKGIDAAITDPEVMKYYSKKFGYSNIKVLKKKVIKRPLVISFQDTEKNRKRINLLRMLLRKESK